MKAELLLENTFIDIERNPTSHVSLLLSLFSGIDSIVKFLVIHLYSH